MDWDVALLQEVTPEAHRTLLDLGGGEQAAFPSRFPSRYASAILARNGWRIHAPALMAALPLPERGIWAVATRDGASVSVGSLHVANAANGQSKRKQAHYVCLVDWLSSLTGHVVLGMDANHAWDQNHPDLPGAVYPLRDDDWREEFAFFSADNTHGLQDVWLEHLATSPEALARAQAESGARPSAHSYAKRRRQGKLIFDRLDYIFASAQVGVACAEYRHDSGVAAGSDHGVVVATLSVPDELPLSGC